MSSSAGTRTPPLGLDHQANAMRKLDLRDVTEVVKCALRTGLITLD